MFSLHFVYFMYVFCVLHVQGRTERQELVGAINLINTLHTLCLLLTVYGAAYTKDLVCGAHQLYVYNKYAPYTMSIADNRVA